MIEYPSLRPWKGIDALVLEEAGVTIDPRGLVRVPYRDRDGSTLRVRFFTPDGRAWWGPGDELAPLGLETLPDADIASRSAVLVAEGESDALALREAFAGTLPSAPIPKYFVLGLPGASTWQTGWAKWLEPFPVIYLVGDDDPAGRRMIDSVHRDLPWARPVWLDNGDDARQLLQRDGPRALDPHIDRADVVALLCVAFTRARTYQQFVAMLRGEENLLVAA